MSDVSSVSYSSSVKQSFLTKTASMASFDTGADVSIFMDAMEKGSMPTTIDDLLKEEGGALPDDNACKKFVDKLLQLTKNLFAPKTEDVQPKIETKQEQEQKDDLNFTFETQTELE